MSTYCSFIIMKRAGASAAKIVECPVVLPPVPREEPLLKLGESLGSGNTVLSVEGLIVEGTGDDGARLTLVSLRLLFVLVDDKPKGSYFDVGHDDVMLLASPLLVMTVTEVSYELQSQRGLKSNLSNSHV
eukprot:scaffold34627_cov159-Amphora_coffeaeformis.AAC.5